MKKWMLFREGHTDVHYFWNGERPLLVCGARPWPGSSLIPDHEEILIAICDNKRKSTFQVPGNKCRYIVVARGEFQEP